MPFILAMAFIREHRFCSGLCGGRYYLYWPAGGAVEIMGDKALESARCWRPGALHPRLSGRGPVRRHLCREAEAMGMPVMIKAAAGGGGRGIASGGPEQLLQSIALARSEAEGPLVMAI